MRKKLLSKINLLLSAVSLGLVGCHPAKSVVQPEPLPEQPQPAPDPNEPTPVMYGVPWSEETR